MEKQLVIFELGNGQYGIEIAFVESIVKMQEIITVPYAPDYVKGVTNLRGSVLPVMNLNLRLGLPEQEETGETRIITVNLESMKIGMIVSNVTEVMNIDDSIVEAPPAIICNDNSHFITGVAKIDKRLVVLLDINYLLNSDEMDTVIKFSESSH